MRDMLTYAGIVAAETFVVTLLAAGALLELDQAALLAALAAAGTAVLDVFRQWAAHRRAKLGDELEWADPPEHTGER